MKKYALNFIYTKLTWDLIINLLVATLLSRLYLHILDNFIKPHNKQYNYKLNIISIVLVPIILVSTVHTSYNYNCAAIWVPVLLLCVKKTSVVVASTTTLYLFLSFIHEFRNIKITKWVILRSFRRYVVKYGSDAFHTFDARCTLFY